MIKKAKILIVDDHNIFRIGLRSVLETFDNIEIIGEAPNGVQFLKMLANQKPDVVLMDISMPEMDGIEATEKAIKIYPDLKIIALSSHDDQIYYYKMIKAGGKGFIIKNSSIEELEIAINTVCSGEDYFSPSLLKKIILNISNDGTESLHKKLNIKLTKREKEILLLICKGYSNKEIADELFISHKTADKHRTNLLSKTMTKNSASLVMFAIKNKLINI